MKSILYLFISIVLISCNGGSNEPQSVIMNFNPVANFKVSNDTLNLEMNLSDAVHKGISIPSTNSEQLQ